jgi:hypothetical protein
MTGSSVFADDVVNEVEEAMVAAARRVPEPKFNLKASLEEIMDIASCPPEYTQNEALDLILDKTLIIWKKLFMKMGDEKQRNN